MTMLCDRIHLGSVLCFAQVCYLLPSNEKKYIAIMLKRRNLFYSYFTDISIIFWKDLTERWQLWLLKIFLDSINIKILGFFFTIKSICVSIKIQIEIQFIWQGVLHRKYQIQTIKINYEFRGKMNKCHWVINLRRKTVLWNARTVGTRFIR